MAEEEKQSTHIDIGLSKEDMDRIQAMRRVDLDGPEKQNVNWFERANLAVMSLTPVKLQEKVTFFQLLSVMINAGVPIIRSLYVLADQMKNPRFKGVIQSMGKRMEEGSSLSKAMEQHRKVFTEAERGMVASGEASGNLNDILKDIAKQAEKGAAIVAKVKGAMIYPIAIMSIMAVALLIMLTMVVPKLTALFEDNGQELPTPTKILIAASEFAQNSWELLIVAALVAIVAFLVAKRNSKALYMMDVALLRVPVFGTLVRKLMLSRFARMLSSMMAAGIPIVKALEINANAVGNAVYKRRIHFASQDVAQGIPLGENLTGNEFLFPPMVANMILVGEQTANLGEVSTKIADFYEDEVDTAVASLSKLMEPFILVVMGSIVGFIVAAVMQPIMSLSDLSGVV